MFLGNHHVPLQVNHLGLPFLPGRDLGRIDPDRVGRLRGAEGYFLSLRPTSQRDENADQQRAEWQTPLPAAVTKVRSNDDKMTQVKFRVGR